MTALPLTPQDMAIQASELAALLTGAPESLTKTALEQLGLNQRTAYMRYGPAMRPADTSATINGPPMQPSQSPAVSGASVPSQAEPSAVRTGLGGDGKTVGAERSGDPTWTGQSAPNAPTSPPAPKTVDDEIKAIEAVAPHLTLPGPLFQRLKETGVVKYPGMMSDRINCLRGLSVEQLRYIRTGVR